MSHANCMTWMTYLAYFPNECCLKRMKDESSDAEMWYKYPNFQTLFFKCITFRPSSAPFIKCKLLITGAGEKYIKLANTPCVMPFCNLLQFTFAWNSRHNLGVKCLGNSCYRCNYIKRITLWNGMWSKTRYKQVGLCPATTPYGNDCNTASLHLCSVDICDI